MALSRSAGLRLPSSASRASTAASAACSWPSVGAPAAGRAKPRRPAGTLLPQGAEPQPLSISTTVAALGIFVNRRLASAALVRSLAGPRRDTAPGGRRCRNRRGGRTSLTTAASPATPTSATQHHCCHCRCLPRRRPPPSKPPPAAARRPPPSAVRRTRTRRHRDDVIFGHVDGWQADDADGGAGGRAGADAAGSRRRRRLERRGRQGRGARGVPRTAPRRSTEGGREAWSDGRRTAAGAAADATPPRPRPPRHDGHAHGQGRQGERVFLTEAPKVWPEWSTRQPP